MDSMRYEESLPPQRDGHDLLVKVQFEETIPAVATHFHFDVFEGDPVRAPLTSKERALNEVWVRTGEVTLPDGTHYFEPNPDALIRKIPAIVGKILSPSLTLEQAREFLGAGFEPDFDNLVVTTGKNLLLDRLFGLGTPPGALTAIGVGNSATAAAVGDTQLGGATPSPDLRLYDALPTRSGLVVTSLRTYATGEGNMNWQEIAQFNGTTNGTSTMFNRIAPIGAFNKTSAVAIQATMTTTQT